MSVTLLLIRVALALVFAVASIAKFFDLEGTRLAMEQFGFPRRTWRSAAVVLACVELAVALGLLFGGSARWAAVAAAALLLPFSIAAARLLLRGEAPECRCFGSLGSSRVGWGTLVRNLGLLCLAVVVIGVGRNAPPASAYSWLGAAPALSIVAAVTAVAVGVQAVFLLQLFKQNGRLLKRVSDLEAASSASRRLPDRLAVGEPAPRFVLPDLDGRPVSLDDLLAGGEGLLLVFTDPGCAHCAPLLTAYAAAQAGGTEVPVAILTTGEVAANRPNAERHGIGQMLVQDGFSVADRYHVLGAPAAVLLDAAGYVAAERADGARAVRRLLADISLSPERDVKERIPITAPREVTT